MSEGHEADTGFVTDGELWVESADLPSVCGWELKPEGFCRNEVCIPLPRGEENRFINDSTVNLSALWSLMGNPVATDRTRSTWVLGTGAQARNESLQSLEAPDFTLPDFDGKLHALSNYRRMRVLLLTWASW